MHNLSDILKRFQRFSTENSPTILTVVAATGTVTTAFLAAKASFRASELIRQQESLNGLVEQVGEPLELDGREKVELTWKLYVPAASTGVATIACIVGANRISSRRGAAIATALTLTETAFHEYKDKVVEQIGVNKEQKIRDEIMRDRMIKDPASSSEVLVTGDGDVLCYEAMTGRYFKSNMEALRKAQNDVNSQIIHEHYASLNDFYRSIGLPATGYGEEVGWNTNKLLELQFSTVLSDDGKPCLAIGYSQYPFRDYYRFH